MRRSLVLLCLIALTLTACGGGSPEEQMYTTAIDTFFAAAQPYDHLAHRVVYIQPTFADLPQKAVPAAVIARIATHTQQLGLAQVANPAVASGGVSIKLSAINTSSGEPLIRIERVTNGLTMIGTYKLRRDALGWNAELVSAIGN